MRPIRLDIEGIKSFSTKQTIDFEELSAGGFFGIFGDTGSGKSTVIECVIFALYGETASSQLNISDFINCKSETASVEFVFLVGERRYLVHRRLAYKRSTSQRSEHNAEVFDITEGRISKASGAKSVNEYISGLLSLSKNEFLHCIALVQGEYDKFIKADNKSRKEIIGNMFGLSKYGKELAEKIKERENAVNIELSAVTARIEQTGALSASDITKLKKELKESDKEYQSLKTEAEQKEREIEELKRVLDERERCTRELKIASEREAQLRSMFQKAEREFEMLEREFSAKKAVFEKNKDALSARIIELRLNADKLKALGEASVEIQRNETALQKCLDSLKSLRERAEKCERDLSAQYAEVYKSLENFSNSTGCELVELDEKSAFEALNVYLTAFSSEFSRRANEYLLLNTESATLIKEQKLCANRIETALKEESTLLKETAMLNEKVQRLTKEYQSAKTTHERLMYENASEILGARLKVGDNCPVCGNPVLHKASLLKQDMGASTAFKDSENALRTAEAELKAVSDSFIALNERLGKIGVEVESLKNEGIRLKNSIEGIEAKQKALDMNDARATLKDRVRLFSERMNGISGLRKKLQSEYKELCEQILVMEKESASHSSALNAIKQSSMATTENADALKKYTGMDFNAVLVSMQEQLRTLESEHEKLIANFEKNRRNVFEYKSALAIQKELSDGYIKRLEGLPKADSKQLKAINEICVRLKSSLMELYAKKAVMNEKLVLAKEADGSLKTLRETKTVLDKRLRLLQKLKEMTRANKLMEWLSEEYITEFTKGASLLLESLTNGEMLLEYTTEGFYVVDRFNSSEKRKVSTVSGGERFLVSLALAVSVSRALTRKTASAQVQFMFIDEGFGSLSENKIDLIMDALESLSREGVVVGVISHVLNMQHRLPRQIYIERKNELEGSRILNQNLRNSV